VPIRSVLAGIAQQAAVGTLTAIVGAIPGAPSGLVVTNSLATAAADDDEADESLRGRARAFWTTVRRGTLGAIQAGALGVPGVRTAEVFETLDATGRPARMCQLVVSDAFTDALVNLDVVPATYQTQAQTLASAVFAGLSDVRAGGIYIDVQVAQVVLQAVRLALSFNAGVDTDAVAQEARSVVVGLVNEKPPGSNFARSAIVDGLRTVPGLYITGDEVLSPAGDVIAQPLQAIRTSLALVTAEATL
jgi:hypothetical protein